MAGFYPDVPAPRLAWDRNGTTAVRLTSNPPVFVSTLTEADMETLNSEGGKGGYSFGNAGGNAGYFWICLIFPEPIDLRGMYISGNVHSSFGAFTIRSGTFQVSTNTTTGVDGTWVDPDSMTLSYTNNGANSADPRMRSAIMPVTADGINAVRFSFYRNNNNSSGTMRLWYLHVFGSPSNPEAGLADRLRLWHPTLDQPLDDNSPNGAGEPTDGAWFDYGDVPRGIVFDQFRQFRVKNQSATLTANSVSLEVEVLTDATPPLNPQFDFDVAGGSGYANPNVDIGSLAPGAVSSVVTLRRTTPADADLGLWWARVVADATSWT